MRRRCNPQRVFHWCLAMAWHRALKARMMGLVRVWWQMQAGESEFRSKDPSLTPSCMSMLGNLPSEACQPVNKRVAGDDSQRLQRGLHYALGLGKCDLCHAVPRVFYARVTPTMLCNTGRSRLGQWTEQEPAFVEIALITALTFVKIKPNGSSCEVFVRHAGLH